MDGNMVGFQPLENKMKIKATALFPRLTSYFIAGDCLFSPLLAIIVLGPAAIGLL